MFSSELPNCPGSPVHVLSKIHEKWHNCEGELRYLGYLVSKRFDLGLFVNGEFTKPKWCHKNGYDKPPTNKFCYKAIPKQTIVRPKQENSPNILAENYFQADVK